MSWKYVFVKVGNAEVPVIFPERIVHAMMVDALKLVFGHEARLAIPPTLGADYANRLAADAVRSITTLSAGSCEVIVRHAGGHSETLGVTSRLDDRDRLNSHPYTGGLL